jgi:phage N-6-adenine-methyltransferase
MHPNSQKGMTSSSKQNWRTPPALFKWVEDYLDIRFTLDVAADDENHLCPLYMTKEHSALEQSWGHDSLGNRMNVWCNPPYNLVKEFCSKAVEEVESNNVDVAILLIPARTDTKWFHDIILPNASNVWFIKGRINFIDSDSENNNLKSCAMFPSMLVEFSKFQQGIALRGLELPMDVRRPRVENKGGV